MAQSQYEDLFTESEDLLKQMTDILGSSAPLASPEFPKGKKRRLKKWFRVLIILFILPLLLVTLAMGGGEFLQILGGHFPLRYETEVRSQPQRMSEEDLNQSPDGSSENMARVRVSLEIKAEKEKNKGRLVVQNLPTNDTRLRFSVKVEGETEPFFRSKMLAPGYEISEIPLERKYLEGKHKGQILLEFYEMEQENKITESTVDIIINASEGR